MPGAGRDAPRGPQRSATARAHEGYAVSQSEGKLVADGFGWMKTVRNIGVLKNQFWMTG